MNSYYWATPSHPLGSLTFHFSLSSETSQVEVLSCLLHSVISNMRSALPPTTSLLHESKQWALQPARKGGRKVHRVGVSGERERVGERRIVLNYSSRLLSDRNTGTPVRSVWESRDTRGSCQWPNRGRAVSTESCSRLETHVRIENKHTAGISCSR